MLSGLADRLFRSLVCIPPTEFGLLYFCAARSPTVFDPGAFGLPRHFCQCSRAGQCLVLWAPPAILIGQLR